MNSIEKLVYLIAGFYGCDPMYYGVDAFAIAQHLASHGVTVQEWVSVNDGLPEEKVNCIVHYRHAYCGNDGYWAIETCFYDGEKFQLHPAYKVTHWMPIPEPPEGE